jgi:WD40 repeat protein
MMRDMRLRRKNDCMVKWLALAALILTAGALRVEAQSDVIRLCPPTGIQTVGRGYPPGGIILTQFDRTAIWVYNVDTGSRYPLPDTVPCGRGCRLSPDGRWLAYFNARLNAYSRMRIDGTGRELLSTSASDVVWWSDGSLFIWTPAHNALLRRTDGSERPIDVHSVLSVQPNGLLGVRVRLSNGSFTREIVDLDTGMTVVALGADRAYFNAHAWSPDGSRLAFVSPVVLNPNSGMVGSEIFLYTPRGIPQPVTNLNAAYGAVRINGLSVGELSWSPDSTRIAFWVTEMFSADPTGNLGQAIIHVLDLNTGAVTAYCGYGTNEHTPNPPRLVWSPDGNYVAFGGIVPDDAESGYHLLALDVETGIFTSLSRGVAVVFGAPNVVAWGTTAR